jgi:hypothetical protein
MATGLITYNVLACPGFAGDSFDLDLNKVAKENRIRAEFAGWNQRVPDAAAVERSDRKGRILPEAEHRAEKARRMRRLVAHYMSGSPEWNLTSRGGPSITDLLTIRAFSVAVGKGLEDSETMLAAQAAKRKVSLADLLSWYRGKPGKVQDEYNRLRGAEDEPEGDGDDLLAEVMKEGEEQQEA